MNGDPARARFFAMQAMRLGGLMMVIAALLGLNGVLPVPPVAAWPLLTPILAIAEETSPGVGASTFLQALAALGLERLYDPKQEQSLFEEEDGNSNAKHPVEPQAEDEDLYEEDDRFGFQPDREPPGW